MNKHKEKETGGLIKQCVLVIGLGIAILVFALFASGLFFTGAVVTHINGVIK